MYVYLTDTYIDMWIKWQLMEPRRPAKNRKNLLWKFTTKKLPTVSVRACEIETEWKKEERGKEKKSIKCPHIKIMKIKLNLITHSIDSRRKEELDTLTQTHRKIHTHTHTWESDKSFIYFWLYANKFWQNEIQASSTRQILYLIAN